MRSGSIFIMVLLLCMSFSLAMTESITVKTDPANEVKVYAWPNTGGQLLNINKGPANDEGFFTTTFFSLSDPLVKFQVLIIDDLGKKVKDISFSDVAIDQSILFDCTAEVSCNISFGEILTEEELVVEEPQPGEEVIVKESVKINTLSFTERLDIQGFYGSWLYVIGGTFTFFILFVMWFRFQQFKEFLLRINFFSEEGELLRLERRIQHKKDLVVAFHDRKDRKRKIKRAEASLKRHENKLENLVGRNMKKKSSDEKDLKKK